MKNTRKLLMVGVLLLVANAAKANILAIEEMKQELTILTQRHAESKVNLKRAKIEEDSLGDAVSMLKKSIKLAVKSDSSNQRASQASIESVGYSSKRNPYLADMGHVAGQASLSSGELNRGTHY